MRRIEVCEVIRCYHLIEIDDDLDIEEIIQTANENLHKYESGCEAITVVLERVKDTYGLEYEIKCGYCGTEIDGISIVDEVD